MDILVSIFKELQETAIQFQWLFLIYSALIGLLIGSFLNVVISRTPPRMFWQWKKDAIDFLNETENLKIHHDLGNQPPNVVVKQSHCPKCGHSISWWENIPVVSYIFFLRGKCRGCKEKISIQYPLVEIITGILFGIAFYTLGMTPFFFFVLAFLCLSVCITGIDQKTTYIPDGLVYSLLWLGLASAALGVNPYINLTSAVWGCIVGYLSLWTVFWIFKLFTGKEGIGYGDFKLLAALGAWTGVSSIIPIFIVASISGCVAGLIFLKKNKGESKPFAFGPYLVLGGVVTMFFHTPFTTFFTL